MSKHNHSHCLHDLKYCEHCDVVYCTKCDREWGGHSHYQPYIWYYYGTPYTVRWGDTGYNITCSTGEVATDGTILNAFNTEFIAHNHSRDTVGCSTVP